jgi:hypothetical protein
MSFAERLRQSRSSSTAALHKFLTTYDPNDNRVYAFVEGVPDRAFYQPLIESFVKNQKRVYVHSCEGKKNVYEAFSRITGKFPECQNILFFVDKDLDDLIGCDWPSDPRIFVTDVYSIENYLVSKDSARRYLFDFVKLSRTDLDPVVDELPQRLNEFHEAIVPLMSWIVAMKRAGINVILANIKMSDMFKYDGTRVSRIRAGHSQKALIAITKASKRTTCWRQVRTIKQELLRQADPKRYVRGKFEAWFFMEFIKHAIADLKIVAAESGGSVSVTAPLHDSNFVQLLVPGLVVPTPLKSFLAFHLNSTGAKKLPVGKPVGRLRTVYVAIMGYFRD